MIINFNCKETDKIFKLKKSHKFPREIQDRALMKLWMIDASTSINDLRIPPANHLEKLKGIRKNQYSIRINDKWRICFIWIDNNAHNVEITDYH